MTFSRVLACVSFALAAVLGSIAPRAAAIAASTPAPSASASPSITITSGPVFAEPTPSQSPPSGSKRAGSHANAASMPTATPTQDPVAQRDFERAREWWRARTDVPFVRYGALVRYLHNGHVFDNWWDAKYRSKDGALSLFRLVDVDEDRARLRGVPFSIFGVKVFDTNKDAEPIRLDAPQIDPASSFGVITRFGKPFVAHATVPGTPSDRVTPEPTPTDDLRQIGRIESTTRVYDIRIVGTETLPEGSALHLSLTPLRDPKLNRLRDLWLDPATGRTLQSRVQGILDGKPYDGDSWTLRYTLVDGREYLQQIVADEPLRFGFDVTIPKFEFDFVDYRFPNDFPKYTFDRPF